MLCNRFCFVVRVLTTCTGCISHKSCNKVTFNTFNDSGALTELWQTFKNSTTLLMLHFRLQLAYITTFRVWSTFFIPLQFTIRSRYSRKNCIRFKYITDTGYKSSVGKQKIGFLLGASSISVVTKFFCTTSLERFVISSMTFA